MHSSDPAAGESDRRLKLATGTVSVRRALPCRSGGKVKWWAQPNRAASGKLLQQHRTAARLTQAELAERAGLSTRRVQDLERGLRRFAHADTTRRLANVLGLSDHDGRGSADRWRTPGRR